MRALRLLGLSALLLAACDEAVFQVPGGDAGVPRDTGVTRLDVGFPDASAPPTDAGPLPDADAPDAAGPDAQVGPDAQAPDAFVPDSGAPDAGAVDSGPCAFETLGPADRDRVIVVGHNQTVTDIRSLTLTAAGTILNNGTRLNIQERFGRAEFTPSGELLLVLTEEGTLMSVAVNGAASMTIVDQVSLPGASYGDLRLSETGREAWIVGFNSNTGADKAGLATVAVGCDGELTVDEGVFREYPLSQSMAVRAGDQRAVFLGGGVDFFQPMDPNETRILQRSGRGWTETAGFNLFDGDSVDALRIALSPDGQTLVIPNGSPFSSFGSTITIVNVDFQSNTLAVANTITGVDDAREAIFSPDGATALVTQFSTNRVQVLSKPGATWQISQTVTGIGLAEQMAMVKRGSLSGRVYLPSIDASGPLNIAVLQITGPGQVQDLGQFDLGNGSPNAPTGIAIMP